MNLDNKITGLTDQEVACRVKEGKVNIDESKPEKTIGSILIKNIFTLFNLINVILALSVFLVGSYKNMLFICVVFFNTIIGIVQEIRSKKAVDKLTIITGSTTKVLRNNKIVKIPNKDIVLDDVVFLERGNQISADCKVISGSCYANESLLTGESELIKKSNNDTLLSGSFINSGNCYAKVISVGAEKYASRLNNSAKYYKKINSEILFTIQKIIKVVTCILVPLGALLFINQYFILNGTLESAVVKTVAALIGMIPEGLVLLTSTVLAVSVIRLSRRNVLVQDLYCIETLARVDVLCLDKTGTLTCDEMQIEKVIPNDGVDIEEVNSVLSDFANNSLDYNSTMNAIRDYVTGYEFKNATSVEPFSSENKCSEVTIGNTKLICGAGEFILNSDESEYLDLVKSYEENYRVLTFISIENGERKIICSVLLKDKLRKNAKQTLDYFKEQDVALKIISGDSVNTIVNIAKEFNIDGYEKALDCSSLNSDEELKELAEDYTIFGRVTPQQKEILVQALHDNGHSVAMTGDGVNDVLALKRADCSVAMASGSEAAKCVSQIVLADNDFSSMPQIVAEGRRTIHNIQRSSSLFLVKNIFSILLSIIVICCGIPYPFQSIQLSFIGGLTIGIPSFILALEYNNNRVKENFFVNIITGAMPAGLTITLNVIILTLFGTMLGIPSIALETICVLITAFTLFVLVVKISLPFNKLRFALVAFIFVFLIIGFTFANDFLNLILINNWYYALITIIFFGISVVMFLILTKISEKIRNYIVK
jgi:cation-transporting ATPase E